MAAANSGRVHAGADRTRPRISRSGVMWLGIAVVCLCIGIGAAVIISGG